MLARFGAPRLSYGQLFSFQILYSNNADSRGMSNAGTSSIFGKKKGEWKAAILELDFTMGTLFLQDKDRIIMSESFEDYRKYKAQEGCSDDTLVSVRFNSGQWEIMTQNGVEKQALQHLLQCIIHDMGAQDAAELGMTRGLVGMDKDILKHGLVYRRAKTAYKKDERFLVAVAGKLLLFKGMDIVGKHVRSVTSLFGASTHLIYGQLEFEVIVPDSKSLLLIAPSAEELTDWIGIIEKATSFANKDVRANIEKSPSFANKDRRANADKSVSKDVRANAETSSSFANKDVRANGKQPAFRDDEDARYKVGRVNMETYVGDNRKSVRYSVGNNDRVYQQREFRSEDSRGQLNLNPNPNPNPNHGRGRYPIEPSKAESKQDYMEHNGIRQNMRDPPRQGNNQIKDPVKDRDYEEREYHNQQRGRDTRNDAYKDGGIRENEMNARRVSDLKREQMANFSNPSNDYQRFLGESSQAQRNVNYKQRSIENIERFEVRTPVVNQEGQRTPARAENPNTDKEKNGCVDQTRSQGGIAPKQQIDHRKMFAYYMNLYRRGLRSSSTQTDR